MEKVYGVSDLLQKEHEAIERELIELEDIVHDVTPNFPNLKHTFLKLTQIWDVHEAKEEKFFIFLQKQGFTIPIKTLLFEHGKLKRIKDTILNIILSGKQDEIKKVLEKEGRDLIKNIKEHMRKEEWIFYALPDKF